MHHAIVLAAVPATAAATNARHRADLEALAADGGA